MHAGEQIETNLSGWITLDAALEDGYDGVRKCLGSAGAVGDGRRLEAVQLVEGVVYGCVTTLRQWVDPNRRGGAHARDEMVDIVVFGSGALRFVYERGRSSE